MARRKQKKLAATPPADFVSRVRAYCDHQKKTLGNDYRYKLQACRDSGAIVNTDNKGYCELYFDTTVFRLKNPKFQKEVVDQSVLCPHKIGLIDLRFWAPAPNPDQVVDECLVTLDGNRPSDTVYPHKLLGI
ncbi:MAG: hypothetical protein RLZZ347_288 [Candidatus Parcubacteria bacterium]